MNQLRRHCSVESPDLQLARACRAGRHITASTAKDDARRRTIDQQIGQFGLLSRRRDCPRGHQAQTLVVTDRNPPRGRQNQLPDRLAPDLVLRLATLG